MTEYEPGQDDDTMFRDIETEFRARPDHQAIETVPPMITMPTTSGFDQMRVEREEREAVEREQRTVELNERLKREKLKRRKRRLTKTIAATAVVLSSYASLKSGGLIDKAGDRFVDAGDVVASAIGSVPDHEPKGKDMLSAFFSELDERGPGQLIQEVEQYKQSHASEFASETNLVATGERIDNAETNDEVVTALDEFMSGEYGIAVGYHTESFDDRKGDVKGFAKATVEVFGALPKGFVALAEVDEIVMSNEESDRSGTYSEEDETATIILRTKAGLDNAVKRVASDNLPYVGDMSNRWTVAHELGHALDSHLSLPVSGSTAKAGDGGIWEDLGTMGRELIQRPEFPTEYAKSDSGEHSAEVLAGVLSRSADGLADVDEWRRFGSESNKNMIRMLAQLEGAYPGIAKILVANRLK